VSRSVENEFAPTQATSLPLTRQTVRRHGLSLGWPLGADATAALGLLSATLAFYYPLVFLGRALVDYDAFVYFFPQRVYLARALLEGRIPLWDPDLFLGAPFLANPQTAVLYPPSWLFVLGPVQAIYSVQLVLHGFLAALFTYLLARRAFDAHPLAAAIGGLAYAFGGFAVGQVGHLNQISAAAWLPAVLLAYARFARTGRWLWVGLGALALCLQLLAGHPQETYMTVIVLGLFGVTLAPWRDPRRLVWCGLGGVALCGLGGLLSAAQLLPTLELAPLSIRGAGVEWRDAVAGSLPSYLSVRALLPPYWLNVPYTEYLGYVGVVPVALAGLALLFARSRGVLFGALIATLGVFLALGENTGLYQFAFSSVPGFDTFRVPARWLLLWEFGVALLATIGATWIARGARLSLRRPDLWLRVVLVVTVLVVGLAWQQFEGEPFPQRRTPFTFAALTLLVLGAAALPYFGRPLLALGLLAGVTGLEVWSAADASLARQAPPPAYTQGESVDWLVARGVTAQERLLSLARPEYVPSVEPTVRANLSGLPGPLVDTVLVAQKWHDTLTPNVPLQFGFSTADGYDGGVLPLQRWLRLSSVVVDDPRPDGVLLTRLDQIPPDRVLDLLGVRYLIANASVPARPGLELTDVGDLHLLARTSSVPRSLIVYRARTVANEAAALARLDQADFDSNHELVLEAEQASSTGSASQPQPAASAAAPVEAVEPSLAQPERWRARVSLSQPGYLLQREAWYPGWRARVDGVDVPLLRADVLYRAVPLPAGEHQVDIFFDSASFQRGSLLSLAGLIAVIGLCLTPWLTRMRVRVKG
jgi:hypothetical protein